MPRYEYRCPQNQKIVEVEHPMADLLKTWGQVCERAGINPGSTPLDAPVEKLLSLSFVGSGRTPPQPCERGTSCCRFTGGCQ